MHEFLGLFTYSSIDRILFFLSYRLCSRRTPGLVQPEPWLLQVIFSAFLLCAMIVAACMNPISLRSNMQRDKNNDKKNTYTSEIISRFVIIIEKQGYSKIKQMKEKLKYEKKNEKEKGKKESSEKILVIFFVFWK